MPNSACVKKILILAAIPHGLRLDKEISSIEEAIQRAAERDLFKIKCKTAVRSRDIRRAIAEERPQIIHFCGHGREDGSLMLEDDGGENKPVSASGLVSLFQLHTDYVECVLLNACHSAKLASAISEYINYAIGMNQSIGDKAAIAFAQGFYDGLGYPTSDNLDVFQRAFEEGKTAINLESLSEGQIPVLITKTKDKPLSKKKTKPENIDNYYAKATDIIIGQNRKSREQLSQLNRDSLEEWGSRLELLPEEAVDIENEIFQKLNEFERGIKTQIEKYKNKINSGNINEFEEQFRNELSKFQDSIGLGKEAEDKTGKRVGDEIISTIYIEVADDLLCQKQLNKAKVFLEEAAKLDKNNPSVYKNLAFIWLKKEKYNKGLVELYKAKRLFVQEKMLENAKEIDLVINRIPISSRIKYLIDTVLQMCLIIVQRVTHIISKS